MPVFTENEINGTQNTANRLCATQAGAKACNGFDNIYLPKL